MAVIVSSRVFYSFWPLLWNHWMIWLVIGRSWLSEGQNLSTNEPISARFLTTKVGWVNNIKFFPPPFLPFSSSCLGDRWPVKQLSSVPVLLIFIQHEGTKVMPVMLRNLERNRRKTKNSKTPWAYFCQLFFPASVRTNPVKSEGSRRPRTNSIRNQCVKSMLKVKTVTMWWLCLCIVLTATGVTVTKWQKFWSGN